MDIGLDNNNNLSLCGKLEREIEKKEKRKVRQLLRKTKAAVLLLICYGSSEFPTWTFRFYFFLSCYYRYDR